MNLYYAIGGGLGHLTRARAFLHTFGIEKDLAILTASEFAADKRVVGDIEIISVDKDFAQNQIAYREFLKKIFSESSVETLFLDAFPVGIIGEFCDFDFGPTEVFYVARLLKWNNYVHLLHGKIPRFKQTFVLETLEDKHQKFIDKHSAAQIGIELKYPHIPTLDEKLIQKILAEQLPFWLIVHAGSDEETNELFNFAQEMREIENAKVNLVLVSPNDSAISDCHNIYPASALFRSATRIFTAGGFNAIAQTKDFRGKHFAVPFARRFDDQFARVSRLR